MLLTRGSPEVDRRAVRRAVSLLGPRGVGRVALVAAGGTMGLVAAPMGLSQSPTVWSRTLRASKRKVVWAGGLPGARGGSHGARPVADWSGSLIGKNE